MLPQTPAAFMWHFLKQQPIKFATLFCIFVIWGANDAIFPYLLKRLINTLSAYEGPRTAIYSVLFGVLAAIVALWFITELLMRVEGFIQISAFPQFQSHIREAVFNHTRRHSHTYFSNHFAGDVARKLSDLPKSCQTLVEISLFQFSTAICGIVVVLILMWKTYPLFASVLLAWVFIHLLICFLGLKKSNTLWEIQATTSTILSGKLVDTLTNMLNVRLFARGAHEWQHLKKQQTEEVRATRHAMTFVEFLRIGLGLNGLALIFGMIFLLVHEWIAGHVTIGDFTQIIMQSFWLLGWMWYISFQLTTFAREWGTVGSALALIQQPHDIIDAADATILRVSKGEIRFEHVNFAYQAQHPFFSDLNVIIHPGEKVGLVGASGSGKSTFVNLLLRFFDINTGTIFIDGQSIHAVTQDSLREAIAMIPQDPSLFHRSLLENIRYGRLDATDEEVKTAAHLAHCDEFIDVLDEGYHALVGERGVKLSGGQRQRIAIARAILKNAPILVLDEATSALDSVTEKRIQLSLTHVMHHRTTLVIAHRLSTLAHMDRLLVFDHGHIVEQGTQTELLQQNGQFARLWREQREGFL